MVDKQKRVDVHLINQTINLFWTGLFFTPIVIFWVRYYDAKIFFFLLGLSLVPLMMNNTSLWVLQLSRKKEFYEQLGIKYFQSITQNGKLVKKLINLKHSGYRIIRNRGDIKSYKNQIRVYEKYHLICFLFFFGSVIFGLIKSEYYLSAWIFLSNICYNIVPILIQQYNKIRITSFLTKVD